MASAEPGLLSSLNAVVKSTKASAYFSFASQAVARRRYALANVGATVEEEEEEDDEKYGVINAIAASQSLMQEAASPIFRNAALRLFINVANERGGRRGAGGPPPEAGGGRRPPPEAGRGAAGPPHGGPEAPSGAPAGEQSFRVADRPVYLLV